MKERLWIMNQEKGNLLSEFTNLYPVSKTLRFELKPVGRTQEHIEYDGILDADFQRAEDYKKVKKIIDRYHKEFIEISLRNVFLTKEDLNTYKELYETNAAARDEKWEKHFNKAKESLRKQIERCFKDAPAYKNLFKKELVQKDLIEFVKGSEEETKLVQGFKDFTTYFQGFYENRKNMYSAEDKSTAIAYRLIHQNLPKFIDNMHIFQKVEQSPIKDQLNTMFYELKAKIDIASISDYFALEGFSKVLTQSGIDVYNTILGGYAEGNVKVQGLNERINLYNQQLSKEEKKQLSIPKLKPLFKQILSDRESISFIPEQFADDQELLDAISEFYRNIQQTIFENEELITISQLFGQSDCYNWNRIYVKNDAFITTMSKQYLGDWSIVTRALEMDYDLAHASKKKGAKYEEKRVKELKRVKYYAVQKLNQIVMQYNGQECQIQQWMNQQIQVTLQMIYENYDAASALLNTTYVTKKSLCNNQQAIGQIKLLLDSLKQLQNLIKPIANTQNETDKDELFYSELIRIWNELDPLTLLYNRVRNYVTKKPYSLEKVKLNFNKSTLLNGWDKNKERDNLGIILRKDGLYYLGIINPKCTNVIEKAPEATESTCYEKMEYKLLPGANKMLPKVFFAEKNIEEFNPSEEILAIREDESFKKGNNFSLENCHKLIDFYKQSISKHKDWSKFGFEFTSTSEYQDISGFYREVENQGYKISFRDIDVSYIDELVEQGQLYLFQIYNKDFSPYSKGTPNLHTLYWKALFSPENISNVVYKLNGEAEVFYRKASIAETDKVVHKANEPVKNKDVHTEKETSVFEYDLVKDKRYTVDKYQFHVPITMNFQAQGENYMNRKVNQMIHDNKGIHVIGIDRGERNLLYLTLVDPEGRIIKQMSLNEIISYDKQNRKHVKNYHDLLDVREKENKSDRQNWKTVNTIKELKEGYLSQVIHVITKLMVEYNAIVVLEDLNSGFMRGRQKFEKQVYQKFEKMLIDKLNYCVDKTINPEQSGGLLHAYQLTKRFDSFKKLGKQSGFLFYIPAWNTSKMDPTTGFVNLFYVKYESVDKTKEFIKKFDSISYNSERSYFEFAFDYSKFTYKADGTRLHWTICTHGERIENFRNPEKNNEWDSRKITLTTAWKKLLEKFEIDYTQKNLIDQMLQCNDTEFFKTFMRYFRLILQMRNSDAKTGEDWICSPVMNEHGKFYFSGEESTLPLDADANGAYNIARKGLWVIEQIQSAQLDKLDKIKLAISNKEWLKYAQEHTL